MGVRVQITQSFYGQLVTIVTIVVASIIGFKYGVDEMKSVVAAEVTPLIAQIQDLKEENKELRELISVNTDRVSAVYVCTNTFLDYYNMKFHKEFITPERLSLTSDKKRKK